MKSINEKIVAALPTPDRGNRLHYFSGAKLQGKVAPAGFAVRVTATGAKAFVRFYRKDGRQYLETLGRWSEQGGDLTVLTAILAAQERAKSVRDGDDPRPARTRRTEDGKLVEGADTVAAMLDEFVDQYVVARGQRSAGKTQRILQRLVAPCIGAIKLHSLRRSDVARMLDKIAKENGPVMADRTFAIVRKAFHWKAARDDDFHPPVAKDMARASSKPRDRFLSDEEIRDVWTALDSMKGTYPAIARMLLLTASRRGEVGGMRWTEIVGDVWTVPIERYKTKRAHEVPLTIVVRSIIDERPREDAFVFSSDGRSHFGGWTKAKGILDKRIADLRTKSGRGPMPDWTVHDLRHTARTLMARAGVPENHAERVLGHTIRGVEGVYNQHPYLEEKRDALEKLAAMIERILNPLPSNVETLGEHRARALS